MALLLAAALAIPALSGDVVISAAREVYVGPSDKKSKTVTVPEGLECPEIVNKVNWTTQLERRDEFRIEVDGDQLTATRIDQKTWWGLELKFICVFADSTDATLAPSYRPTIAPTPSPSTLPSIPPTPMPNYPVTPEFYRLGNGRECKDENKKVLDVIVSSPEECARFVADDQECDGTLFEVRSDNEQCRCLKVGLPCERRPDSPSITLYRIVDVDEPPCSPCSACNRRHRQCKAEASCSWEGIGKCRDAASGGDRRRFEAGSAPEPEI